jgi:hypothetical protein
MLFDKRERTDSSPKRANESTFAFYNRIAEPYFDRERALLEEWVAGLLPTLRERVISDLRSGNDSKWTSGWFEMYLDRLFRGLDFSVIYEPEVAGSVRRPDFLVMDGDGASAYVEARAVFGPSGPEQRRRQIEEAVSRVAHPRLSVWVEWDEEGPNSPRVGALQRQLQEWLDSLDVEELEALLPVRRQQDLPAFVWSNGGWRLVFTPWVKSTTNEKTTRLPTLVGSIFGMTLSRDRDAIQRAMKRKASRYGRLDRPLVVALLCNHVFVDDEDVVNALYGSTGVRITMTGAGEIIGQEPVRNRDGLWRGPLPRPSHTTMSALMLCRQLFPASILSSKPKIWLHPEPRHALGVKLPFPSVSLDLDRGLMEERPHPACPAMADLLAVEGDWPSGRPWERDP